MPRQPRIEFSGAWYHVLNRGAGRQTIFHNTEFYIMFLEILAKIHTEYQVEIHSYCLMSNHYHLLIRTNNANLSEVMRQVNGIFAKKHNFLLERDGPVFKGRYKAILVPWGAVLKLLQFFPYFLFIILKKN